MLAQVKPAKYIAPHRPDGKEYLDFAKRSFAEAFSRTSQSGHRSSGASVNNLELVMWVIGLANINPVGTPDGTRDQLSVWVQKSSWRHLGRRVHTIAKGFIGFRTATLQVGDIVCALDGAAVASTCDLGMDTGSFSVRLTYTKDVNVLPLKGYGREVSALQRSIDESRIQVNSNEVKMLNEELPGEQLTKNDLPNVAKKT